MAKQARAPEQKEQRRAAILKAAEDLLRGSAYDQLTMADIARQADLAKGTVYLYFPSKDDLFLQLLGDRQSDSLQQLGSALNNLVPPADMADRCRVLAKILAAGMADDPLLVGLAKLAINTLEAGAEYDSIVAYKTALFDAMTGPAGKLAQIMGGQSDDDGVRMLTVLYALMLGFSELADTPETIMDATRDAGRPDLVDYKQAGLSDAFATVLRGFAAEFAGQ